MTKKHVIRAHRWVNGRLQTWIETFDTLESAVIFANTANAGSVKIYNDQGLLVHHQQHQAPVDLYA
jgi:hypothetical protein